VREIRTLGWTRRELETWLLGTGLRPTTKGVEKPPDPKVRAPALDPTLGGGAAATPLPYPTCDQKRVADGVLRK
jgi:hypothetical protein